MLGRGARYAALALLGLGLALAGVAARGGGAPGGEALLPFALPLMALVADEMVRDWRNR